MESELDTVDVGGALGMIPRLEAFRVHDPAPVLRPSSPNREWMDAFPDRHPYRCLPLAIANAHGWDVLCPLPIEIEWNGGPAIEDLVVRPVGPVPIGVRPEFFARSNFSRGIVTLHTGYLFRTPPGWNLLAAGPFNQPKAGISPLTGIIESDWLPYPFTMNWQMLDAGKVRFERGEPFCTVLPIPKQYLEDWEVVVHDMADDPVLQAEHETFREERGSFMARMNAKDPSAIRQAWQRHYFVGRHPDGTKVDNHVHRMRLAEPRNAAGARPLHAKDAPTSSQAASILAREQIGIGTPSRATHSRVAGTQQQELHSLPSGAVTGASMPNWRPDSQLNKFLPSQDEGNYSGRRRVHEGILARSPKTTTVTTATAPSSLDFLFVPEFLKPDELLLLREAAERLSAHQHVNDIDDPYWRGRILFYADVNAKMPEAALVMRQAEERIVERLTDFYRLTAPLYVDTVQLVQWREGMFMEPHADRANPDGSPHGMSNRDFASIVYLNDDYAGGELYLTRLDTVVRPATGMLVAFTGGWHHEHAVLKVSSGLRITMPSFLTFDETKKDKTVYA